MRDNKHNPEGYLDLTAYGAIHANPKPGEVWKYERRDGKIVEELIIRNYGEFCNTLMLIDDCMENCISVKARPGNNMNRYVNPQMLHYTYNKKMQMFVMRISQEEFLRVVETVKNTLDFESIMGVG